MTMEKVFDMLMVNGYRQPICNYVSKEILPISINRTKKMTILVILKPKVPRWQILHTSLYRMSIKVDNLL